MWPETGLCSVWGQLLPGRHRWREIVEFYGVKSQIWVFLSKIFYKLPSLAFSIGFVSFLALWARPGSCRYQLGSAITLWKDFKQG